LRRFGMCWTRSAIAAPSVHRTAARLRLAILAAEEANSMEQRRLQLPRLNSAVPGGERKWPVSSPGPGFLAVP
jgi:hypothetical protein